MLVMGEVGRVQYLLYNVTTETFLRHNNNNEKKKSFRA